MRQVLLSLVSRLAHWKSSLAGVLVLVFAAVITWGSGKVANDFALDNTLLLGVWGIGVTLLLSKDHKDDEGGRN